MLCFMCFTELEIFPFTGRREKSNGGVGVGEGLGRMGGCGAGGWSQVANNGPVLKNVTFENGERHTHWVSPAEAEWRNLGGAAEHAGIRPSTSRPPAKNND